MAKKLASQLPLIGWRETLNLPQLNVTEIKVKVDTGARSSALHAFKVEEFYLEDRLMIRFQIHPRQKSKQQIVTAEAELLEYRQIKSSNGQVQKRPVILTEAKLGALQWPIELTLTRREMMGFRMLLGRQAIRDRFLVDPGKSFLQSQPSNNST